MWIINQKRIKVVYRKNSRAQAALEFLTTYGWAFLVILIMVGALAYFGILNPSNVLPSRCNVGTEFLCQDYQITENGATSTVTIRLKNNMGEPVTVQSLGVGSESAASLTCTNPALPTSWRQGEIIDLAWTACSNMATSGLIRGGKGKVNFTIDYYSVTSGSAYVKQVKGEVYTTIR